MQKKRVLVQWIGHSDLRAMAVSQPALKQKEIMDVVKGQIPKEENVGPARTLLDRESFEEVILLSNYEPDWNRRFKKWIGTKVDLKKVDLKKPTDYQTILKIADGELANLKKRADWSNTELCLHLSPGTPAMAAVWLLLGKTRYPATFFETFAGNHWVTNVPFDLTIDVIPEILRDPDSHLQHLASEAPTDVEGFQDIIGDSKAIRTAVGRAKRAAMRGISVLLLGESGTGKEMFAQAIHQASPRRDKPFVVVNCAALSETLLESELFGHAKGAFTGANDQRKGVFEAADGGTIFLDEIGETSPGTQAKLLRVLQPLTGKGPAVRKIVRLGESKEREVDVRIIAATNRDPHAEIKQRRFREDLYYRLAVVTITLPPLRERKTDISKISSRLLDQLNRQFEAEEPGYQHKHISDSANAFVKRHEWPGNVRQLYNVLVQAMVLSDKPSLTRADIAAALGEMPQVGTFVSLSLERSLGDGFNLREYLNDLQASYLRRAMEESNGVKTKAASLLGYDNYQTLDAQLKRLNVTGDWDASN
jgi:DNA-binding NtrC family response regulator